jgi:hypothetical protein
MLPPDLLLRRLAFIRYLYDLAVRQSLQPEPLQAASVLTFHDSVELFLELATEHRSGKRRARDLMDYVDVLAGAPTPYQVSDRGALQAVNDVRNALKHRGVIPSRITVESCRANAGAFFLSNTQPIFDVVFDQISMVDLVKCAEARTRLANGRRHLENGDCENGIAEIAIAYRVLIDDVTRRTGRWFVGKSPLEFVELSSFGLSSLDFANRGGEPFPRGAEHAIQSFANDVQRSLESMEGALAVLCLGLDYTRYFQFLALTPGVSSNSKGEYTASKPIPKRSLEECRMCLDFVVDSALRIQDSPFGASSAGIP